MMSIDFSDRFGSAEQKAGEIGRAMGAIRRARGVSSGSRMDVNVVTHSAGDADFDYAASRGQVRGEDVRVVKRIAVGPVYGGTYVGNVGEKVLGKLGKVGRALGQRAASELAEGSEMISNLQRDQSAMRQEGGVYDGVQRRVDILTNGAVALTPRLDRRNVSAGDGFVQSQQRRPHVSETRVVDAVDPFATNHLMQPGYRGVLQNINDVLKQ